MKLRRRESSEEISGFLDQGTTLTGELQFSGTLRIDGNFHGSIVSAGVLSVGEHAVIHADIKAGELEVHGRVFGNIEGKRRVEVYPTGRVCGDVHTPLLVINPGATFDGRSCMVGEREESTESIDEAIREQKG
jgi:cytoskeletal protein CcmA (bactofilin family)